MSSSLATTMSMPSELLVTPLETRAQFRTLEITATASYDAAGLGRAMSREAAATKAGAEVQLYGPAGDVSHDGWVRYKWRVWWVLPTLWRDELTWPNGERTVIIVRKEVALAYVSMQQTLYTNEPPASASRRALPPDGMHLPTIAERLDEFPLIHPRLPNSEWELTTVGRESYSGRVARRVRATRRTPKSARAMDRARSGYWPGVDEYEYVVEDALKILLSLTGLEGGVPVATISADTVNVDAPIDSDMFTFEPPDGTRVAHIVSET